MLKVLLVDDEPFIIQGLKVLVDWEAEDFEVVTASDGNEALSYLKQNLVDLIIADIKMPIMNGIELLKAIRTDLKRDTDFVILSGYAEFSYAQQALSYNCTQYILKPVEKDRLLEVLKAVRERNADKISKTQDFQKKEKAYFDKHIMALLSGKFDKTNVEYIRNNVSFSGQLSFLSIQLDSVSESEDISDEEKKACQRKLFAVVREFLKENEKLAIIDSFFDDKIYDVGLLFYSEMASSLKLTEDKYVSDLYSFIHNNTSFKFSILVGKHVADISGISKSYGTVNLLRSVQGFRDKKDIYYYEEECQVTDTKVLLCKKELDELISAIECNEVTAIHGKVEAFYDEMGRMGITKESMDLNINYLLFQLIHLASEQDDRVNQEEILRLISENSYHDGMGRGSKVHLFRMAKTYGDYLSQLRKKVSKGVLAQVEAEIKNNYSENLTLKDLSEKYYVNSAYLGQLFRKKYGCSFKDYLNKKRVDEAASLLIKTDKKIYQVAEEVGYRDVDYFVNKFIEAKGCTPAKYRKQ